MGICLFFVFEQEKQVCICPAVLYCDPSKETEFFSCTFPEYEFPFSMALFHTPPKNAPKPTAKLQIQTSSHFTLVLAIKV